MRSVNSPASLSDETVPITIEPGQGVNSIAALLTQKKIIRSPLMFKVYLRLNGLGNKIQAGEYNIPKNLNIKQVAEILKHGTFDARLTIIEGWRVEEIAEYIGSSVRGLNFSGVDFLEVAKKYEGRLFPETYIVPKYITPEDLVDLMVSTFNQKFDNKMRQDLKKSDLTLEQALILASIVEREVKFPEDRPKVAGILLKRFKNNWSLEADATVQYVLGYQIEVDAETGEQKGTWWKNSLHKSDLEVTSPYNTRKNSGLPPAPICNPGLPALKAVVEAEISDFWYYVSDAEGKIHYAKTLEEHNENVAKYIKKS